MPRKHIRAKPSQTERSATPAKAMKNSWQYETRKKMKRLTALLLLTGSAFAAQSCPVQVTSFGNYGNEFRIGWENVSDKPTAGVRFGAYYTSLGEKHDFLQMLEYNGAS
jgi:hypothetical protein